MDQVIAFFVLNVKMLKKDKLKMIWSLTMPAFFLIINCDKVVEMTDMRFGWTYIIISSYIYGIGIHSLTEKEAGTLKTAFSISGKAYTFFFANLFTQIVYSFVCLFLFNLVSTILYGFSFFYMNLYSVLYLILFIPIAFFCYNITLIRNVHVNSLSVFVNIVFIMLFLSIGVNRTLDKFNPFIYFSNLLF